MFGSQEMFFEDVKTEYEKQFGPVSQGEEAEEAAQKPRKKALAADVEDDDEGRTAGTFGGQESGGRPAAGKLKPGDMIKDLSDLQRKSGYY